MRRTGIVLFTAALLAGSALASSVPASAGTVLAPDITIPLSSMYGQMDLLAATGSTLVRKVYVTSHSSEKDYSVDNGASWAPVPDAISDAGQLLGYKGTIIGLRRTVTQPDDEGCDLIRLDGFVVWNPTSGALREVAATPAQNAPEVECLGMADAVVNLAVLNDGRVLDISGSTAVDRTVAWGRGTPAGASADGVSADGTIVAAQVGVWDQASNSERSYLAVGRIDGKTPPATVEVPRMSNLIVSGQRLHYLLATKSKLAVCRAQLTTPAKPTCVTLRSGDNRGYDAYLEVSQGLELVSHHVYDTYWTWMVRGSTVKKLNSSATVKQVRGTDFRDPQLPLVQGIDRTRGYVYGRVNARLAVAWTIQSRKVPAQVMSLALTPNRVAAFDRRPHDSDGGPLALWYRTTSGGVVGPEVRLERTGTTDRVFASAARTAADCCTSVKAGFYDGARLILSQRLKFNVLALSGPYAAGGDRVWRVDGRTWSTADYPAIFGSLAATVDEATRVVTIKDLATPSAAPITLTLPSGHEYYRGDLRLWGDWVSISWGDDNDVDSAQGSLVVNYRTSRSWSTDQGKVADLGDGLALLYRHGGNLPNGDGRERTVLAWNFLTDASSEVPVRYDHEVAIDGVNQVAWVTDTAIEIATVPGVGRSAPRLLGVVAKSSFVAGRSWKPQVDVSKRLDAGVLELRSAGGQLVRTVTSTATASGSLRTLAWNGRNDNGAKVPSGTYTWVLKAEAVDGTGTLTGVTGQGAATGTVKVTR